MQSESLSHMYAIHSLVHLLFCRSWRRVEVGKMLISSKTPDDIRFAPWTPGLTPRRMNTPCTTLIFHSETIKGPFFYLPSAGRRHLLPAGSPPEEAGSHRLVSADGYGH